jgi:3,4-dihydroxy 2-butanone 4-phosphate synthase/GTP cyclohydrolase II
MEEKLQLAREKADALVLRVNQACERLRSGRLVIMVDDETRENEGDFVFAAEFVTPELINFMSKVGRGLICLSLSNKIADRLRLPFMVDNNRSTFQTAFTVSIEAKEGVTTGISAHDRAQTIKVAVDDNSSSDDLVRPGHVFPLRARDGGVLVRTGQTEGSVDLARIAGLKQAAVICEIMSEDGSMARLPELKRLSEQYDIPIISVADIVAYRLMTERLVEEVASSIMPTLVGGEFKMYVFRSKVDDREHVALVKGQLEEGDDVLVRVHSECLTGDAFGSLRCDCGAQLENAMRLVNEKGKGVVLYLRQEGRGIGLGNKIKAYHLQDHGLDTVEANLALGFQADLRDYGIGAQILLALGIRRIKLITNNPKKLVGIRGYGIEVVDQIPNIVGLNDKNMHYLKTKQSKLGHMIFGGDEVKEK